MCETNLFTARWVVPRIHKGRILFVDSKWNGSAKSHLFHCMKHNIDYSYQYQAVIGKKSGGCPECNKEVGGSRAKVKLGKADKLFYAFEAKAMRVNEGKFSYLRYRIEDRLIVNVICHEHYNEFEVSSSEHLRQSAGGCIYCATQARNSPINGLKYCNDCGLEKSLSEFPVSRKNKSGDLQYHFCCFDCKRIRDKKYDEEKRDKEKAKEATRRYYAKPENKEAQRRYQMARYIESNPSHDITIIQCTECGTTELIRRRSGREQCLCCQRRLRSRINYESYKFKRYHRPAGTIDNCKRCGVEYSLTGGGNEMYCPSCREKNRRDYKRNAKRKRRNAKRISGIVETVIDIKVFERDKWRCKICGRKVQKKDINAGNAAEVDHIIPIAKGGVETYSNVQTLCRSCNQSKSDRLVGQLVIML